MEHEMIFAIRYNDLSSEYALFQVERETPDRVYGKNVSGNYTTLVMGRSYSGGLYIEKKYVIARNVTPELFTHIVQFIEEQERQVRGIWNEFRAVKDSRVEKIIRFTKENQ